MFSFFAKAFDALIDFRLCGGVAALQPLKHVRFLQGSKAPSANAVEDRLDSDRRRRILHVNGAYLTMLIGQFPIGLTT